MTDLRKAAEMALEALEEIGDEWGFTSERTVPNRTKAINELRQALAQPEQEPNKRSIAEDVGRLLNAGKGFYDDGTLVEPKEIQMKIEGVGDGAVVCTEVHLPRPPKKEWVGLTVNEARKFYEKHTDREELIYAIDKFLEEKNGG